MAAQIRNHLHAKLACFTHSKLAIVTEKSIFLQLIMLNIMIPMIPMNMNMITKMKVILIIQIIEFMNKYHIYQLKKEKKIIVFASFQKSILRLVSVVLEIFQCDTTEISRLIWRQFREWKWFMYNARFSICQGSSKRIINNFLLEIFL